ncbi:MAG: pilus assembly protein PilP [Pseudomonadota bacterium]
MSSPAQTHPRLRIILSVRHIGLWEPGAPVPIQDVDLMLPEAEQHLAQLAADARRRSEEVDVILPEAVIARGTLAPGQDVAEARASAAAALSAPEANLLLTLGEANASGARDWAAVDCDVVVETRIFITACGLTAASIAAPGALPAFLPEGPFAAFAEAPRPDTREAGRDTRRVKAALGAGGLCLVLLLSWLVTSQNAGQVEIVSPVTPPPMERIAAAPAVFVAAGGPDAEAALGGTTPHARPTIIRDRAPDARAIAPEPLPAPAVTVSSRALPIRDAASLAEMTPTPPPLPLNEILTLDPRLASFTALAATRDRTSAVLPINVAQDARPARRPDGSEIVGTPEVATDAPPGLVIGRPRSRADAPPEPDIATPATTARAEADPDATRPKPRDIAALALARTQRAQAAARSAPTAPRASTPAPAPAAAVATAAAASATEAAPQRTTREITGFSARDLSLVGIFGKSEKRRALIRLPNGQVRRVHAGDRFEGGRILTVGADSVRFRARGRETVLRMED